MNVEVNVAEATNVDRQGDPQYALGGFYVCRSGNLTVSASAMVLGDELWTASPTADLERDRTARSPKYPR